MEEIKIYHTRPTKPHRCHSCGEIIPARAEAIKFTKTTTIYTCMNCETNGLPPTVQTNFEKITASPEALAAFLGSLPVLSAPWDDAFHRKFCGNCTAENCDAENCHHQAERDSPVWWLAQEAGTHETCI